jgi:hypothetical protein
VSKTTIAGLVLAVGFGVGGGVFVGRAVGGAAVWGSGVSDVGSLLGGAAVAADGAGDGATPPEEAAVGEPVVAAGAGPEHAPSISAKTRATAPVPAGRSGAFVPVNLSRARVESSVRQGMRWRLA